MIYDRRKELDEATIKVLNESRKEMRELKKQVKIQSKFVLNYSWVLSVFRNYCILIS